VMLPGMDGIEVCTRLRQTKSTPVIMLTAKGEEVNPVHTRKHHIEQNNTVIACSRFLESNLTILSFFNFV
jgi:CheY-like chemotaxis protein